MKALNKIIFPVMLLLTILGLSSCKKDWLDVNYNPRELTNTSSTPDLLLPPLLEEPASFPPDFEIISMWMGYWTSPGAAPGQDFSTYTNTEASNYPSSGIFFLEDKSKTAGMDFYVGIAKVLRALAWSRLVDKLNNVPYFDAYQASILRPKYDSGQLIYEDLMKQLTMASTLIKNADLSKNPKLGIADIMFKGDRAKWLSFINTLKLRLLVHQANLKGRGDYIAAEIDIIKKEGSGFLPTGTDAAVNPGYGLISRLSPYFGFFSSDNIRGGGRGNPFSGTASFDFAHANVYALNMLKIDHDPRIGFIYSTVNQPLPAGTVEPFPQPAPANFRGSQLGLPINGLLFPYLSDVYYSAVGGSRNTDVVSNSSSGIIKGNNMDAWVMTSVESAFLQAEAVYRGWLPGDPETFYKVAVNESFRWLNVGGNKADPGQTDFLFQQWYNDSSSQLNTGINWKSASDKYKLLMRQKYIALNGIDPYETWTDYRRNGYPQDIPVSADPARKGNTIPIRLVYTTDEYVTNPDNVKAQGTIDMFTGKIWWMQ